MSAAGTSELMGGGGICDDLQHVTIYNERGLCLNRPLGGEGTIP